LLCCANQMLIGSAVLPVQMSGRRHRAPRRSSIGRPFLMLFLSLLASNASQAEAPKARIVGLGATTCQRFNDDVGSNPSVRQDYLAWVQGYMSGILLSRPPGVDEGLDLSPATFDLINQLHFLETYCAQNTSADFADAVEALYKRLREEGKT
jgi:hypothetical protein